MNYDKQAKCHSWQNVRKLGVKLERLERVKSEGARQLLEASKVHYGPVSSFH